MRKDTDDTHCSIEPQNDSELSAARIRHYIGPRRFERQMIQKMNCRNATRFNHAGLILCMMVILGALSAIPLSSAASDGSELAKLISANEDPRMNAEDLAFFLVTHDFDAVPKKDYVEVRLNGVIYKVVPNGAKPGLADITMTP